MEILYQSQHEGGGSAVTGTTTTRLRTIMQVFRGKLPKYRRLRNSAKIKKRDYR
jgi:hypothetical protein